jgi:hypothetical protein
MELCVKMRVYLSVNVMKEEIGLINGVAGNDI